jgi:hypothetical protein
MEVLLVNHCIDCVLQATVCSDGDICRFGWCRCCGGRLDFVDVFRGLVACYKCGFTTRHKKSVKLGSFR